MNIKDKEEARKRKTTKKVTHPVQDTAIQTTLIALDTTPMMYYNNQLISVHPDALDLIPERVCFQVKLFERNVFLRKMNLPDETGKLCQRAMLNKQLFQECILRRISKRCREINCYNSCRKRKGKAKEFKKNHAHTKLLGYILNEYMVKGESALPMTDDLTDPEQSDEEYYYSIVTSISSKPCDYKEKIAP